VSEGQGARKFEQNRVSGTSAARDAVTVRRAPFAVLPGWFEAALLGPAEVSCPFQSNPVAGHWRPRCRAAWRCPGPMVPAAVVAENESF